MFVNEATQILDRRRFMFRSVGMLATISLSGGMAPSAWSASDTGFSHVASLPTLTRMARDLYPHDHLPDSVYGAAIATIDGQLAANPVGNITMLRGAAELDSVSSVLKGMPYLALKDEADRAAVLTSMQATGSAFFKAMRSGMVTALYNQQELWPMFGYEGSSADKGGYLHRGFNDLDWLPA